MDGFDTVLWGNAVDRLCMASMDFYLYLPWKQARNADCCIPTSL